MAGEFSDGEDSVGHEAELVDATADAEVDLRLPLREPMLQDRPREEIPTHLGVLNLTAIDLAEQCRLAPPNEVKPKGSGHGLSLPLVMNARCDHMLGDTAPVAWSDTGRRGQGAAGPAYPGLAQRRQRAGIDIPASFQFSKASDLRSSEGSLLPGRKQFEPDPFGAGLLWRFDPDHGARVPAGNVESDLIRSPGAVLVDTVERWIWRNCELILCVIKRGVDRSHRDGLVRWHLHPLKYRSLQGLLVGNNTDKCLTLLSCPKDGTTPRPPYNCLLTWRVLRWTLLSWCRSPNEPRRLAWLAHFLLITGLREG